VGETVNSLLNQSSTPLEIILIDDGSNPPLALDFINVNLKLVRFEKEIGVSAARNYGVRIAKGGYVAFLDDDAVADLHWLKEIQKGIKAGADILGGPLEPLYEDQPPQWWNEKDFGHYVSIGNAPNKYKDFPPGIWSSNMALKKEIFDQAGYFNPKLGRQKGKLLAREDVDLVNRAIEKGFHSLFLQRAKVFHKVKSNRMTLKYILTWEYYMGKTCKILDGYHPSKNINELSRGVLYLVLRVFSRKPKKILAIARVINRLGRF
jgi:glycosyltransferase involved in cell wall biosynthesis